MNYGKLAQVLIKKNQVKGKPGSSALEKAVLENDRTSQYKAVAQHIDGRLCAAIGKSEGYYVDKRKLVWDIIDAVNGEEGTGTKW